MKLPILISAGLLATACSQSGLISDTQPAYTHKAPYLALSCEQLRAIKSDTSTAALNGPLQILASRNSNATEKKTDMTKTFQKAQIADDFDARVRGSQQAAAWALTAKRCK